MNFSKNNHHAYYLVLTCARLQLSYSNACVHVQHVKKKDKNGVHVH